MVKSVYEQFICLPDVVKCLEFYLMQPIVDVMGVRQFILIFYRFHFCQSKKNEQGFKINHVFYHI